MPSLPTQINEPLIRDDADGPPPSIETPPSHLAVGEIHQPVVGASGRTHVSVHFIIHFTILAVGCGRMSSCTSIVLRLTRLLGLTFLLSGMLCSTAKSDAHSNTTLTNELTKSLSHKGVGSVKLESATNVCFSNTCSYSGYKNPAYCTNGAYVYKMAVYSGNSLNDNGIYVTKIDAICSDGGSFTVGTVPQYNNAKQTIISPSGFHSFTVFGGCVVDHLVIDGMDFGNLGYTETTNQQGSCQAPSGLFFVGFPSLKYDDNYPSFNDLQIYYDVGCLRGEYFNGYSGATTCMNCTQGTDSILHPLL